jgi:transcriptional regulator with XRE-family HTH domain
MPDTFGARMRETRERQHVALSTIAEQTKIKVSLLEALERDDVSQWPSGIFRRAFIRAYAHAIGLEPDVVVREFLERYPDPPEIFADAMPGISADDARATDNAPIRLKYLVASAIGSVSRLRRSNHKPGSLFDTASPDPVPVMEAPPVPTRAATVQPAIAPPPAAATPVDVPPESPAPVQVEPALPAAAETGIASAGTEEISAPLEAVPQAADSPEPDLIAVAHLCSQLARVQTTADVPPLLGELAKILDAIGVILWLWDPIANELMPALTHGYSERVVAQLPRVERDTNNATAAAFRAGRTCVVKGDDVDNGALAVPLMGPAGCAGVLAIELPERREEKDSVRAYAAILAAQLATLIGTAEPAEASDRRLA